jgi:hypothetical protein
VQVVAPRRLVCVALRCTQILVCFQASKSTVWTLGHQGKLVFGVLTVQYVKNRGLLSPYSSGLT